MYRRILLGIVSLLLFPLKQIRKICVALLLILVVPWAGAATWYVRPASAEYGAEDGTSYATAFDGYFDITWGVGGVVAGDTLIMCGTFNDSTLFNVGADGSVGNIITIDGDCSSQGDSARAKLIAGAGGAVAASNANRTYITFKNLELVGGSGITQRILNIGATSSTSATAINVTVENVVVHDTMGEGAAARAVDYQCMRIDGSNVTVRNVTLYNCEGDGIYAEGNDHLIEGLTVYDVDLSSTPYGDCVQYGGGTSSTEYAHNRVTIRRLSCDRTNKATKHGVIFGCDSGAGTSTGLVLEDSTIRGAAYNVAVNYCDDVTIRRNYLVPNRIAGGQARGVGTFASSSGETINLQSNIFDMQGAAANSYGVFIDQSGGFTLNAYNNVFFGSGSETGTRGIYLFSSATGTLNAKNNAIVGMVTAALQGGAGPAYSATHNAFFGNGSDCAGSITCTSSVTANPAFLGGTSPTTAEGFKLKPSSALCGAGTPTDSKYDYEGYRFGNPANIGAFALCGRDATFSDRTIFTDRTTYVDR